MRRTMNKEIYADIQEIMMEKSLLSRRGDMIRNGVYELMLKIGSRLGIPEFFIEKWKDFGEQEGVLYLIESYRDHFMHPFHVFLLGWVLLERNHKANNQFLFKANGTHLKKWFIVSLWHDITYIAQKGPDWFREFFYKQFKFDISASDDWRSILTDQDSKDAINMLAMGFSDNPENQRLFRWWIDLMLLERRDHGILSAIYLLKILRPMRILSNRDKTECGLAIALHNYHQATIDSNSNAPELSLRRLPANKFPLAYLLAYCDTAQEWGRSTERIPYTNHVSLEGLYLDNLNGWCIKLKYDLVKYHQSSGNKQTKKDSRDEIVRIFESNLAKLKDRWFGNHKFSIVAHIYDIEETQDQTFTQHAISKTKSS